MSKTREIRIYKVEPGVLNHVGFATVSYFDGLPIITCEADLGEEVYNEIEVSLCDEDVIAGEAETFDGKNRYQWELVD